MNSEQKEDNRKTRIERIDGLIKRMEGILTGGEAKRGIPRGERNEILEITGELKRIKNMLEEREGMENTLTILSCTRCGHTWHPRTPQLPKVCPLCKSPYWDKERGWHKK